MKWISVKERLPDTERNVLIYDGAIIFEGWYDEEKDEWLIWTPKNSISFVAAYEMWPDPDESITHWSDDYTIPS